MGGRTDERGAAMATTGRRTVPVLAVVLLLGAGAMAGGRAPGTAPEAWDGREPALHQAAAVHEVLSEAAARPLWTPDRRRAFLARLDAAAAEGIDPDLYHRALLARPDLPSELRDRLLTDAYLGLGRHLAGARLDPTTCHDRWLAPLPPDPLPRLVAALSGPDDPLPLLDALRPAAPEYARLCRALARLHDLAAVGGWPALPDGPTLHPGDRDPAVPALRERLAWEGPGVAADDPLLFDGETAAALRSYQDRCGLAADGVLGPATRAALNLTAAARAEQVRLNLERLRSADRGGGGREVVVNIPAYRLEVRDDGGTVLAMRAVVGRPDRPTPVLSGAMTHLVFQPSWNIPQKLARRDVLPRILADPGYLAAHGIRVYESWRPDAPELDPAQVDWAAIRPWNLAFKLRQEPGPQNPLGRVKFLFPNPASVFIHDTPGRDSFARSARAFSSGCVRVEDPLGLAACLLGESRVAAALAAGGTREVGLPAPVPVRLVYFTAWAEVDGSVHFRDDVYGLDAPLAAALAALEAGGAMLPGADRAGVQVDEAGARVVAHAAAAQGAGGAAQVAEVHAGQAHVGGLAREVEAPLGDAAAGAAQRLVRGR